MRENIEYVRHIKWSQDCLGLTGLDNYTDQHVFD